MPFSEHKDFHRSFENYEANDYEHNCGVANHLALFEGFISYWRWVHKEKYLNVARLPQYMFKHPKVHILRSQTSLN